MSVKDLVVACGTKRIPGVEVDTYWVCVDDIDDLPGTITPPVADGDTLRIDGNIVLKALKKWAKVTLVTDSGEVKDTMLGEEGSHHYKSELMAEVPNTGAATAEWFELAVNGCAVCLVKEKNGDMRLMGNIGSPVKFISHENTSGKESGSKRIGSFTIESSTGRPALYYSGTIDLDPLT